MDGFNGKLRDELLAREVFDTLLKAKVLIEHWRRIYNTVRRHSSPGYRPPAPETTGQSHERSGRTSIVDASRHATELRCFRATKLITLLLGAREEKQLQWFRKQLKQLDLVILDELGYVPTRKAGAELLFDALSTAYESHILVVTTKLPFEQWTEVLGRERLTHRCHILEARGESFSLRDARKKQREAVAAS